MIITYANTKGGVGKTTDAVHTATELSADEDVLLIDADPSAVAQQWYDWRDKERSPKLMVGQLHDDDIVKHGPALAEDFHHTIIDVGGWDNEGLRAAIAISDKVLIPMNLSGFDAMHIERMLSIIEEARTFNPGVQIRVLPSLIDTRANDHQELRRFVAGYGLKTLNAVIHARKAFREATSAGLVVSELTGQHRAKSAIRKLVMEVMTPWT